MKTILVLAQHPDLPDAIRSALDPAAYRVIHRVGVNEAEPLLHERLVNLCVLDADFTEVQTIWSLEKVRRRMPVCPVIIFTSAKDWDWEEEAYLHNVTHILSK